MSKAETIMLAKTYKSHKDLSFPVQLTEKLDGVPGNFHWSGNEVIAVSRQGERLLSVDHVCSALAKVLPRGFHVVGELYKKGMPFKVLSGLARRKETSTETEQLSLFVYDCYSLDDNGNIVQSDYLARMITFINVIYDTHVLGEAVQVIVGSCAHDADEFDYLVDKFRKSNPEAEGIMIRALHNSPYKPAWRSPGMLKMKVTETIDLPIHSFEEAVDKHGEPKGMVGRINVKYKGQVIGVGPGKLTHAERISLWSPSIQPLFIGKMIEVAYMPDPTYDALREPRFYRFRPDKD